jgi:hypothetical protein
MRMTMLFVSRASRLTVRYHYQCTGLTNGADWSRLNHTSLVDYGGSHEGLFFV